MGVNGPDWEANRARRDKSRRVLTPFPLKKHIAPYLVRKEVNYIGSGEESASISRGTPGATDVCKPVDLHSVIIAEGLLELVLCPIFDLPVCRTIGVELGACMLRISVRSLNVYDDVAVDLGRKLA